MRTLFPHRILNEGIWIDSMLMRIMAHSMNQPKRKLRHWPRTEAAEEPFLRAKSLLDIDGIAVIAIH